MRNDASRGDRWQLAALSLGGVLLSHALGYLVAVPDPHERAELLHSTGHGYWSYFVLLAIASSLWGLGAFTLGLLRSSGPGGSGTNRLGATFARLTLLQGAVFLSVEAVERLLEGGAVNGLLQEPAVVVGLLIQLFVALAGSLLLLGVSRVVARVTASRRAAEANAATPPAWRSTSVVVRRPPMGAGGLTLRGPPLLPARL